MVHIGVDLHKASFTVCRLDDQDKKEFQEFENTPDGIADFKKTLTCVDEVAVEFFGFTRPFIKAIAHHVREVVPVDVSKHRLLSESIKKTDKNDAALLAVGLKRGLLPKARVRSEASQQLRSLLKARDVLVLQRIRLMNNMYAILSRNGIHVDRRKMRSRITYHNINPEKFEYGDQIAWKLFCTHMDQAQTDVYRMELEIETYLENFPNCGIVKAIPGIGIITAAYILGVIDNIDDFENSKSLCSYFGIVPATRISSGDPVPSKKFGRFKTGRITRVGDRRARSNLTMCVNRVMANNESLKEFYNRIKARKGYRKARTATARKLLTFIYFALKSEKPVMDFAAVNFAQPHKL